MRIVSGRWKGKALVAPQGSMTRPTSDRARQAVFNILEHAPWSNGVAGARVLDLFAGTGALGLEALSRGAKSCLFVETDGDARAALMANIEACHAQGISKVWKRDAAQLGPLPPQAGGSFDLIFIDPPYGMGLAQSAIASLVNGWINSDGLVVVEQGVGEPPLDLDSRLHLADTRTYGPARISFLQAREGL
jgi:16S rRNA (guanine966-N2)-methyltransferase